jgi:hypothetical protein
VEPQKKKKEKKEEEVEKEEKEEEEEKKKQKKRRRGGEGGELPIPLANLFKPEDLRPIASGIAGSNPSGGTDVCLVWVF